MSKRHKRIKKANCLHRLNAEEIHDPYAVLGQFFSTYHLKDLREVLWEWLSSALGNNGSYETRLDRSNLLFLYESLEKMAEAAYVIHRRSSRKTKSKKGIEQ